jgi:hypothetical protein
LSQDAWVTPLEVAQAMLRYIEDDEKVGGTVLEVGAGNTRNVKTFNDPGPDRDPRKGLVTSNNEFGDGDVLDWLQDENIWGPHL